MRYFRPGRAISSGGSFKFVAVCRFQRLRPYILTLGILKTSYRAFDKIGGSGYTVVNQKDTTRQTVGSYLRSYEIAAQFTRPGRLFSCIVTVASDGISQTERGQHEADNSDESFDSQHSITPSVDSELNSGAAGGSIYTV